MRYQVFFAEHGQTAQYAATALTFADAAQTADRLLQGQSAALRPYISVVIKPHPDDIPKKRKTKI